MSDYIDRDAVTQMINKWADGYSYIEVPTEWAEDEVRKLPPVGGALPGRYLRR